MKDMIYGIGLNTLFLLMAKLTIFNFNIESDISNWRVVDDVVMGGESAGKFELTADGHGRFWGEVSLENNGGFSSVRHRFDALEISDSKKLTVRLKGDGKQYQLRIKPDSNTPYSYITTVSTSGEWQEISVPLADFFPSFRGRKLDRPNFNYDQVTEFTFLIANKRNEQFELLIDWIKLN